MRASTRAPSGDATTAECALAYSTRTSLRPAHDEPTLIAVSLIRLPSRRCSRLEQLGARPRRVGAAEPFGHRVGPRRARVARRVHARAREIGAREARPLDLRVVEGRVPQARAV